MSTVAHSRRSRQTKAVDATAPRRGRRWVRRIIVLSALAALVWFAPVLVAKGPWRNALLGWALSDLHGMAAVGSCSLGWLSSVQAEDIVVQGADEQPLLTATSLTSDKTLLGLLLNLDDLGSFHCEQPRLNLVLRDDGSNLEDALAEWLKPREEPSRAPAIELDVIDGQIALVDAATDDKWQIDDCNATLALPGRSGRSLELSVDANLPQRDVRGRIAAKLSFTSAAITGDGNRAAEEREALSRDLGTGEFKLDADSLPLALFQALLRRISPECELAGSLDAHLAGQWGRDEAGTPHATLDGQLSAANLLVSGPWVSGDRVKLARLDLPLAIARQGSQLRVDRCELSCDAASLSCQGTIDQIDRLVASRGLTAGTSAAARAVGEVTGQIDLAKLAAILPRTLRVREGTRIESGQINVQLASHPKGEHWAAAGRLETTRLVASDQGRQFTWEHPLSVVLAAHDGPDGPVVEKLSGQSDFIRFAGAGTLDRFDLTASYDLSRLADELGRFVDLGELRLAGVGTSQVNFHRDGQGRFEANAELVAENFELARPSTPPWVEQRLTVTASAAGQWEGRAAQRVDRGQLKVESGLDQLTATLREPVTQPSSQARWPLDLRLQGQLARWLQRAEPWIGLPERWQIDGQADLDAQAACSADEVRIAAARLDVERLHVWGHGLFMDEPRVQLRGAANWSRKDGRLELNDATVASSAFSAQAQQAVIALRESTRVDRVGNIAMRADLARLQTWFTDPQQPEGLKLAGRCQGDLQVAHTENSTSAKLEATIDELVAAPKSGQPWRERQLHITGEAAYDRAADVLQLARFVVASDALKVDAAGRITQASRQRELQLAGKLDYDLEQITKVMQPFVGDGVQLTGRESRSFELAGPLAVPATESAPSTANNAVGPQSPVDPNAWLARLSGRVGLGWQSAQVYGFPIGQGEVDARLADGFVRIAPLDLAVSEGRLKLAPAVRLSPSPAELYLPAGPLVEQVRITPEMCNQGLQYIAPVLAGVAQAQGRFSIDMEGCRLPISDPTTGDAAGKLTIHTVEIGPGPLVEELAVLMNRAAPAKLKRESQVEFRLVQGRVYHRGLELVFPEITVRTYGSVGLDQTLAIMAEFPIPPKWLRDNALGNALKDQTIQVPIAGTLKRPKLDGKVLDQLARQSLQSLQKAGEGLLRNELNKQLDRLLPRLQPAEPKQ